MKKIMKKKNINRVTTAVLSSLLAVTVLTGCGSSSEGEAKNDVTKITIGCNVSVSGVNDYLDEDDNLTGSTVELMRAIDEKLEDYEFELVPTSFDDVFVGLEAGTYQGGEANAFLTAERIEKYAIPEENICASYIGLLVKKENADLTSFEDVAKRQKEKGITFYSMQAGNGLTYPVEVYNEEHPDEQIEFEYTSENTNSDVLGWIANGRYDVGLALYSTWNANFVAEDGAYHEYLDDLAWIPIQTVGVYNLFNKDQVSDEFLAAYDEALRSLKEDGTASKISEQFFGYDVFESDFKNLTEK
jgi:L-cystine transport system substrate-binding protein